MKEALLDEILVLRATVTDKKDRHRLDDAIDELMDSLRPGLWIDDSHLDPKRGDKVFQEEKEVVQKLSELLRDKKSTVEDALLVDFIARIVGIDRELAQVAVSDVDDGHKLREALRELAKGDRRAADGEADEAIDHYRNAWQKAQDALKAAGEPDAGDLEFSRQTRRTGRRGRPVSASARPGAPPPSQTAWTRIPRVSAHQRSRA